MSSRTRLSFDVKLNDKGETIRIVISDPKDLQADNLALATWGSSIILANLLHRLTPDFQGTGVLSGCHPVLELGAGTGLVGLSAAAIWHTTVLLTDLPPIVPHLQANFELNRSELAQHGGCTTPAVFDWAHPDDLVLSDVRPEFVDRHKARVLLAADTVYSEEHPELLVNAIRAQLAAGPSSRVILCYPLRVGYLDHIRDLWQRLEEADLECIEEGRESIDESWDEDTPYEWCVWRWKDAQEINLRVNA